MAGKKTTGGNQWENTPETNSDNASVTLEDYAADTTPAVEEAVTEETSAIATTANDSYEAIIVPPAPVGGAIAKPKKKRNWKKIILILVILIVVGAIAANYLLGSLKGNGPTYVETQTVEVGTIQQTLGTTGTLTTAEKMSVYAPISAPITSANLELGSYVNAGDLLYTFDTTNLSLAQKKAVADANLVSLQGQNTREKSAQSQEKFDVAKVSADSVRSQRDAARTRVNELTKQLETKNAELAALMTPEMQKNLTELEALQNQALAIVTIPVDPNMTAEQHAEQQRLAEEAQRAERQQSIDTLVSATATVTAKQGEIEALSGELTKAVADAESLNALFGQLEGQRDAAQAGIQSPTEAKQQQTQAVGPSVALEIASNDLAVAENGVVAPISGIITSLTTQSGGMPMQYSEMCVIQSISKVNAKVSLTKYDMEQVREGQTATITSLGNTYTGKVTEIAGMATETTTASGTTVFVNATVALDNPDANITLGLEADVVISTGQAKDVLTIPTSAVNTDVDGTFCFILSDGFAVRKPITVGLSSDTNVEVVEGITAGDTVILASQSITDGMMVSNNPALKPAEVTGGMMMVN